MVTLRLLAVHWILMYSAFFVSVAVRIRNADSGWDKEAYGRCIILQHSFGCFSIIFCFQLQQVLTNYYGRFVKTASWLLSDSAKLDTEQQSKTCSN